MRELRVENLGAQDEEPRSGKSIRSQSLRGFLQERGRCNTFLWVGLYRCAWGGCGSRRVEALAV